MRFYAQRYTTFAFDTPGNGLSDPLPGDDPDMTDYANAQADLLRDLGLQNCVVYGRHTGASIGVEMAYRRPELISMVMTDGYPVFSKEQRDAYLSGYLSDLPVNEDGSHLTWLWHRYRDQFLFWPWNKRSIENRADCDMPDIEFLQNGVIALMEAGNNYKAPYRAVFKHEAMDALEAATPPICVAARPGDSLFRKLKDFPAENWVEEIPSAFAEATAREAELIAQHAPTIDAPIIPDQENTSAFRRSFAFIGGDQLHVARSGAGDRPLVLIGPAPGAVLWRRGLIDELAKARAVVAIDPAGCGESDAPADNQLSLERQADRICAVLDRLGVKNCDLVGIDAGGGIAIEVSRRIDAGSLVLCDPLLTDDNHRAGFSYHYAEDAAPRSDGGHLQSIWTELRDGAIYFPWFDRRQKAWRDKSDGDLDFEAMTARAVSLAKHGAHHQALWRAAWMYPWSDRLNNLERDMTILATGRGVAPANVITENSNDAVLVEGNSDAVIASAILNAARGA